MMSLGYRCLQLPDTNSEAILDEKKTKYTLLTLVGFVVVVPMTLVFELDLDMDKMYHHIKSYSLTDTQYENITFPHTRVVKIVMN